MTTYPADIMKAAAEAHADFARSSVTDNLTVIIAKAILAERLRRSEECVGAASQAPEPWQAHDLEVGRSYESHNFGTVIYRGVDNFYGEKTHAFDIGRLQMRYWKTEKLGEFLKPKPAPAGREAAKRGEG